MRRSPDQTPAASKAPDGVLLDLRERVHTTQMLFDRIITGHTALAAHPHLQQLVGEIEHRFSELYAAASAAIGEGE